MTDIEKLAELVERCRRAESEWGQARAEWDRSRAPFGDALTAYEAAQNRLGVEWENIGRLVDAARERETAPTRVECHICGAPISPRSGHTCPPTMSRDTIRGRE
jgi:hypothetical protein